MIKSGRKGARTPRSLAAVHGSVGGGTRRVRFRAARIPGQQVGHDKLIVLAIEALDPADAGPS
ncbi:hypothetical protein [Ideonella sp. A 288]|uniref:hypothetical protein n=1 Tax=Ideonella sp. A 288 TaxID=1962181 RepID=UPI0011848AAC|nr:hypothetical protein [Ideonella sp. A 288]